MLAQADALCMERRFQEAVSIYQQLVGTSEARLGPSHPDTVLVVQRLADALFAMGAYRDCLPLYERLCQIARQMLGDADPDAINLIFKVGRTQEQLGLLSESRTTYEFAIQTARRHLHPAHELTSQLQERLDALSGGGASGNVASSGNFSAGGNVPPSANFPAGGNVPVSGTFSAGGNVPASSNVPPGTSPPPGMGVPPNMSVPPSMNVPPGMNVPPPVVPAASAPPMVPTSSMAGMSVSPSVPPPTIKPMLPPHMMASVPDPEEISSPGSSRSPFDLTPEAPTPVDGNGARSPFDLSTSQQNRGVANAPIPSGSAPSPFGNPPGSPGAVPPPFGSPVGPSGSAAPPVGTSPAPGTSPSGNGSVPASPFDIVPTMANPFESDRSMSNPFDTFPPPSPSIPNPDGPKSIGAQLMSDLGFTDEPNFGSQPDSPGLSMPPNAVPPPGLAFDNMPPSMSLPTGFNPPSQPASPFQSNAPSPPGAPPFPSNAPSRPAPPFPSNAPNQPAPPFPSKGPNQPAPPFPSSGPNQPAPPFPSQAGPPFPLREDRNKSPQPYAEDPDFSSSAAPFSHAESGFVSPSPQQPFPQYSTVQPGDFRGSSAGGLQSMANGSPLPMNDPFEEGGRNRNPDPYLDHLALKVAGLKAQAQGIQEPEPIDMPSAFKPVVDDDQGWHEGVTMPVAERVEPPRRKTVPPIAYDEGHDYLDQDESEDYQADSRQPKKVITARAAVSKSEDLVSGMRAFKEYLIPVVVLVFLIIGGYFFFSMTAPKNPVTAQDPTGAGAVQTAGNAEVYSSPDSTLRLAVSPTSATFVDGEVAITTPYVIYDGNWSTVAMQAIDSLMEKQIWFNQVPEGMVTDSGTILFDKRAPDHLVILTMAKFVQSAQVLKKAGPGYPKRAQDLQSQAFMYANPFTGQTQVLKIQTIPEARGNRQEILEMLANGSLLQGESTFTRGEVRAYAITDPSSGVEKGVGFFVRGADRNANFFQNRDGGQVVVLGFMDGKDMSNCKIDPVPAAGKAAPVKATTPEKPTKIWIAKNQNLPIFVIYHSLPITMAVVAFFCFWRSLMVGHGQDADNATNRGFRMFAFIAMGICLLSAILQYSFWM